MDNLGEITAFVRVVETKSFAAAAQTLGVSPSAVSKSVARLEERLGTRLLTRTTRSLSLTEAGETFYARCRELLAGLAEAESELAEARGGPVGRLRVDTPLAVGRMLIAPALPRFLEQHPGLSVQLTSSDRLVDIVRDGIDVVIRVGELADSSLSARRLGLLPIVTCAAPGFIERHGMPSSPRELDPARCIGIINANTGQQREWAWSRDGATHRLMPSGPLSFTDGESMIEAGIAGAGVIRTLAFMADRAVGGGLLQPLFADWDHGARPVSALYAHGRTPPAKVRAFIDFALRLFPRAASSAA